jgi:hypothetical protein
MGLLFSNPAVLQINNTKLSMKEFRKIKTFKDALFIAGYSVDPTTKLIISTDKIQKNVNACETFQIVDGIRYDTHNIYIRKLYGKSNS